MNQGRWKHADEVVDVLEDLSEDGTRYFRAKDLQDYLDLSTGQIRYSLPALEEDGVIEKRTNNSPYTWKIL